MVEESLRKCHNLKSKHNPQYVYKVNVRIFSVQPKAVTILYIINTVIDDRICYNIEITKLFTI